MGLLGAFFKIHCFLVMLGPKLQAIVSIGKILYVIRSLIRYSICLITKLGVYQAKTDNCSCSMLAIIVAL